MDTKEILLYEISNELKEAKKLNTVFEGDLSDLQLISSAWGTGMSVFCCK